MREHDAKDCNINDSIHDVPPEKDCGHPVMEGPGVNPDGSLMKNPDGETVRKDAGRIGPGMEDGKPLPKAEGRTIRRDSAARDAGN